MAMSMSGMSNMATTTAGMNMGTATGTAAMASSTGGSMDSMGGMGMGGKCKISMLWNWYTIDSCFLASSWHITSNGMFAGSCIGVILLVMALEALRRAAKEYDRFILAQHTRSLEASSPAGGASVSSRTDDNNKTAAASTSPACLGGATQKFRPNVLQHSIRALLHMLQFAVAYFVMLLAMYYNGYIIICIFIGSYLGYFIFGWETFVVKLGGQDRLQEEVTVCCG
ncbi:Ctr-domain-containing protein [Lophiostoma macrostomum CBS 122681]|uniref:Copper transport protein n=1 Tax=Lophiostoma macrostomum CBS 122681 TaxID=1314788 RepID=A0A6A6SQQ1_9PLEO|nr:Ctr-domain-containing protein [Lophiostoma macrostomum CBS 122681]